MSSVPPHGATGSGSWLSLEPDIRPSCAGQLCELRRSQRKHRERGAGGGPHSLESLQIGIEEHSDGIGVPEWRHTADDKPRRLTDEIGVGPAKLFPDQLRDFFLGHAVVATGHYD